MSINTDRDRLVKLQKEKAKLNDDLAKEKGTYAQLSKEANKLSTDLLKTRSESTRKSKQRQLETKQDKIAKSQKKIADFEGEIAKKTDSINSVVESIEDAEARATKKQRKEELRHLKNVSDAKEYQKLLDDTSYDAMAIYGENNVNLSSEAKDAIRILLQMLEEEKITKSIILWNYGMGSDRPKLVLTDRSNIELPMPLDDLEELTALGVIKLQKTRNGWNGVLLPEIMRRVISESVALEAFTIFYSWQSWQSPKTNRSLIENAIQKATKAIRNDDSIDIEEPMVDRDTKGRAGSVDIAATIFEKISQSQIFICDTTIVTMPDAPDPSPNPNVMIELGFAAARLGWGKIICVVNTAFGNIDQMPFDLRHRRLLTYHLPETNTEKTDQRKQLAEKIEGAIRDILAIEYS